MPSDKELSDVSEESDMETEIEKEKMRKRGDTSSISEHELSVSKTNKAAKKKKKKEEITGKKTEKEETLNMKAIVKEIKSINKMSNMLTKK